MGTIPPKTACIMDTSSGTTDSLYLSKASWKEDLTTAISGGGPGGGIMQGGPIVVELLADVAGGVCI